MRHGNRRMASTGKRCRPARVDLMDGVTRADPILRFVNEVPAGEMLRKSRIVPIGFLESNDVGRVLRDFAEHRIEIRSEHLHVATDDRELRIRCGGLLGRKRRQWDVASHQWAQHQPHSDRVHQKRPSVKKQWRKQKAGPPAQYRAGAAKT